MTHKAFSSEVDHKSQPGPSQTTEIKPDDPKLASTCHFRKTELRHGKLFMTARRSQPTEKVLVTKRPRQLTENTSSVPPRPLLPNDAQRSAPPARQRVVTRRVDKYWVRCALSVFIRFHPSPVSGFPGVIPGVTR